MKEISGKDTNGTLTTASKTRRLIAAQRQNNRAEKQQTQTISIRADVSAEKQFLFNSFRVCRRRRRRQFYDLFLSNRNSVHQMDVAVNCADVAAIAIANGQMPRL